MTFTDTVSGVTFTFDSSGKQPDHRASSPTRTTSSSIRSPASTYYIDTTNNRVEAISYLPETTQYAFTAANGMTYLIHYSDVDVVFPVISGANVNAGVATVGTDIFTVEIDEVEPTTGGHGDPDQPELVRDQRQPLHDHRHAQRRRLFGAARSSGDAIAPISRSCRRTPSA